MSSLLFHPALPILIGAFLILRLGGTARSIVLLGAPLVSLAFIWMTADGVILAIPYMEWTLEPFKADKLSRLFATVFAIMGFAGNLYAL
ncbi:MAG: Na+/H+ antiporter subunit D, partial [Rhodospirillaceae bacterium]|nr:Na+/H+ antiporter subunit D [Rhodospirillaceae bacterium]